MYNTISLVSFGFVLCHEAGDVSNVDFPPNQTVHKMKVFEFKHSNYSLRLQKGML